MRWLSITLWCVLLSSSGLLMAAQVVEKASLQFYAGFIGIKADISAEDQEFQLAIIDDNTPLEKYEDQAHLMLVRLGAVKEPTDVLPIQMKILKHDGLGKGKFVWEDFSIKINARMQATSRSQIILSHYLGDKQEVENYSRRWTKGTSSVQVALVSED